MAPLTREARADVLAHAPGDLEFGPFRLDLGRRALWRGDTAIPLSPRVADLLILLITERHRVVDKRELMEQLWPDTFVSEESLTQCVSALRRCLGDDSTHPEYVATVPRRGYRFVAAVHETVAPTLPASQEPRPATVHRLQPQSPATSAAIRRRALPLWVVVAAFLCGATLAGVIAVALVSRSGATAAAPALRFFEGAPGGTTLVSGGTLSPDSRVIAFLAKNYDTAVTSLWVRELDGRAPRLLPGTAGASRPFWAPDSRALGFFSDGRLRTIDVGTNTVQTLATVGPFPVGGSWSSRGVIIYADRRSNLFAVSVEGGAPYAVTTLNRGAQESAHRFPFFLPDGDRFLYYANSLNPRQAGTYISSLSGAPARRVLDASSGGTIFAAPGYLLHVSERRLVAHAFDLGTQAVSNPPRVLANDVAAPQLTNAVTLSVAPSGLLAFGGGAADTRLAWFDRAGKKLSTVDALPQLHNPSITDDDQAIVAGSGDPERRGTWLIDADAGTPIRSVPDATVGAVSSDGKQIAFSANRIGGIANVYSLTLGATADTLLLQTSHPKAVNDWSTDGRYIVFTSSDPQTKDDIWLLPTAGDRQPKPFLRTPFNELQGEVSPDGRWLAYASDESGRWEVYVQAFPDGGWKRAISASGGYEPHWRRDGRELFYLSTDQHVMAVDMTPGAALRAGRPQPLFQVALSADLPTIYRNQFAVTGDGRRFLIDSLQGQSEPITVLLDWPRLLSAPTAAQR